MNYSLLTLQIPLSLQDALESLKQRAELVITENDTLFDQLKTQAIGQVLSVEKQAESEVLTVNM